MKVRHTMGLLNTIKHAGKCKSTYCAKLKKRKNQNVLPNKTHFW